MLNKIKSFINILKYTYIWSPTQLFGNPADFRSTVSTAHPITAPFFQKYYLAARAVQSFPSRNKSL